MAAPSAGLGCALLLALGLAAGPALAASAPAAGTPAADRPAAAAGAGHASPRPSQASSASAAAASPGETFSHGYFDKAPVYRPAGDPRGVALVLSGLDGWTAQDQALAESLRTQGLLAAGIDVKKMIGSMRRDGADCLGPQGDFDNFSRFLQARYQLNGYHQPVLVGSGPVGAALAYGAAATAPADTFSGAISWGLVSTDLKLPLKLCRDHAPIAKAQPGQGHVYSLLPAAKLADPWLVFPQAGGDAATTALVQSVPGATLMPAVDGNRIDALLADAYTRLSPHQQSTAAPPAAVKDLPLVEEPAKAPQGEHDLLAIMLSGDGGWAGIDRDLSDAMNRAGIPVVGFDSLRYFWKARTPDSTAQDVVRVMRYYQSQPQWKRSRILLIGYSQGADVMPFVLNRLPADLRAQVATALLIGMGDKASFEFHVTNWIKSNDKGLPTLPEAEKLPRGLALCVYGVEDKEAVCPKLNKAGSPVRILALKGGHHFDGDYDKLAGVLLKATAAPPMLPQSPAAAAGGATPP